MVAARAAIRKASPLTHRLRFVPAFAAAVIGVWLLPAAGLLVFVGLAGWAMRSDRAAIQSLTIAWLISSLNPEIYDASTGGLRWLVLVAAAVGVAGRLGTRGTGFWVQRYVALLPLSGLVVVSSILSDFPLLSLSKLVSFILGIFVVLSVFSNVSKSPMWIGDWFISLATVVVVLSLPLVGSPLGYVRNGSGFQGILDHPQSLGIFVAPFLVYALARSLISRFPFFDVAIAIGLTALLYLTEARTGVVAAFLGVAAAVALARWPRTSSGLSSFRMRSVAAVGVLLALAAVGLLAGLSDDLEAYVLKSRGASLLESYEISRGGAVDTSIDRFVESPLFGHGFGVREGLLSEDIQTLFGFPVSAPIESGFFVTGVLEQIGLLGSLAFAWLLWEVLTPVARAKAPLAVGLATAAVATNIGEATLASFGGMGLFVWLTIGWSIAISASSLDRARKLDLALGLDP